MSRPLALIWQDVDINDRLIPSLRRRDHTNYALDAEGLALIEPTRRGLNIISSFFQSTCLTGGANPNSAFVSLFWSTVTTTVISVSLVPHTQQTIQSRMSARFLPSPACVRACVRVAASVGQEPGLNRRPTCRGQSVFNGCVSLNIQRVTE